MSALIAYSKHSLWQQAFKIMALGPDVRIFTFSKLPELKDFLHQVDSKVILIEEELEQCDFNWLAELCSLPATKVILLADKSDGIRDLDTRVELVVRPVSHGQLSERVRIKTLELGADEK